MQFVYSRFGACFLSSMMFIVLASCLSGDSLQAVELTGPDFESHVAPILIRRCLECHNTSDAEGDFVLISRKSLAVGGESGLAIESDALEESLLLQKIVDGEMPPEDDDQSIKLPESEIAIIKAWVAAGAPWPENRVLSPYEATTESRGGLDWWSFQPVEQYKPPQVKTVDRVANDIDSFILASLEKSGLTMAPQANRRTLIRRVYFDLVGLPPTPQEIEAFVGDTSENAYEKLIERLLASPRYGERWARYWLDLVRFAETNGYERDAVKPFAWKYRDWVIASFNEDKPYNHFVMQQLAGDELPQSNEETVTGTGFLRIGTWDDEPNDPLDYKYERLADLIHTTSTAFLAITVKCARCHDHKFDPVPQTDYYSMASVFWAGPIEPRGRELMGGSDYKELGYEVLGWTDRSPSPPPLKLLKKGDPRRPQQDIAPASMILAPKLQFDFKKPPGDSKTSQRRLQLAQWIVDPQHPLTARVMVNRIWQHHFGQALVRTPNNFGFKGDRPTHPELLDYLATDFVSGGWTIKRMHKMMMMSHAYRQASVHPMQQQYEQQDFGNHLLWRMNRRRLDAESLRDTMLFTSGQLDEKKSGGPSFYPHINSEALEGLSRKDAAWQESSPEERRRRSVYMFTKRSLLLPLMTTFDFCDTTQPCGKRDISIVAPQALAMLNNEFIHAQSESLAIRATDASDNLATQIDLAWNLSLGRKPTSQELEAAISHVKKQKVYFSMQRSSEIKQSVPPSDLPVTKDLVLWLRADRGVTADPQGRVSAWADASGQQHHAAMNNLTRQPLLVPDALNGRSLLRFNGRDQYMKLTGQVITSQQCSIFAIANDKSSGTQSEIISNWNGAAGNSVTSLFLGTTGEGNIRVSDNFSQAGKLLQRDKHFLLSAISASNGVAVYQNGKLLAQRSSPLATRNLNTPYVIGQQGNYNAEFWNGDLGELIVFNRALNDQERQQVTRYLTARYALPMEKEEKKHGPRLLALASLCHVLLNTNEFIYID